MTRYRSNNQTKLLRLRCPLSSHLGTTMNQACRSAAGNFKTLALKSHSTCRTAFRLPRLTKGSSLWSTVVSSWFLEYQTTSKLEALGKVLVRKGSAKTSSQQRESRPIRNTLLSLLARKSWTCIRNLERLMNSSISRYRTCLVLTDPHLRIN